MKWGFLKQSSNQTMNSRNEKKLSILHYQGQLYPCKHPTIPLYLDCPQNVDLLCGAQTEDKLFTRPPPLYAPQKLNLKEKNSICRLRLEFKMANQQHNTTLIQSPLLKGFSDVRLVLRFPSCQEEKQQHILLGFPIALKAY